MNVEDLIELLAERPFSPIRLYMSNGRTHEIRHPEMAIVGQDVVALGVLNDKIERPRFRLVSIAHINEVESVPTARST